MGRHRQKNSGTEERGDFRCRLLHPKDAGDSETQFWREFSNIKRGEGARATRKKGGRGKGTLPDHGVKVGRPKSERQGARWRLSRIEGGEDGVIS